MYKMSTYLYCRDLGKLLVSVPFLNWKIVSVLKAKLRVPVDSFSE